MRTFFNLLMPSIVIVMLPYRIWENVNKPQPDKMAILLQSLLMLFAVGLVVYRLLRLGRKLNR